MRKTPLYVCLLVATLCMATLTARPPLVSQDDLIRDAATLGSNWTATVACAITDWVLAGVTPPLGASSSCAGADFNVVYYTGTYTDNQYAQIVATKGVTGYEGPAVRISSGNNGYAATLDGGSGCTIYKWVSGSRSTIGSCTLTWSNGDTLRIEASGVNPTTLTVKQNGSTVGTASDSDLDSGSPGMAAYTDSQKITYWEGGDLSGGAPTFVPALPNAVIRGGGLLVRYPR